MHLACFRRRNRLQDPMYAGQGTLSTRGFRPASDWRSPGVLAIRDSPLVRQLVTRDLRKNRLYDHDRVGWRHAAHRPTVRPDVACSVPSASGRMTKRRARFTGGGSRWSPEPSTPRGEPTPRPRSRCGRSSPSSRRSCAAIRRSGPMASWCGSRSSRRRRSTFLRRSRSWQSAPRPAERWR